MTESVVLAEVELFPSQVSGKATGYRSGIRPNHYFHQLGSYAIGIVVFEDDGTLELGAQKIARITFVEWAELDQILAPGLEWEIREGAQVVGRAKVLKVIRVT